MHIGEPTPLDQRVEDVERQIITEALNIHQGRINEVAEYLLIPRKKLYLRMKKYGLNKEHYINCRTAEAAMTCNRHEIS